MTNLERLYQVPIDIEFCYDSRNVLYIVQARPITTHFKIPREILTPPFRGGNPSEKEYRGLYLDVTTSIQGIQTPFSVLGSSVLLEAFGSVLHKAFGLDIGTLAKEIPKEKPGEELPKYGETDPAAKSVKESVILVTANGRLYGDMSKIRVINPNIGDCT